MLAEGAADIMQARKWYESRYSSTGILKSSDLTKVKMQAKPYWELAFCRKQNSSKTVEIPLSTKGRFGFATKESMQAYKESGDNRFMQSLTRMVVLTREKDNKTIGFLMTIIPDKDYQEANGYKVFSSSYKKWQKGFCGFILYHNLDGSFSNGWKLLNGEVVKTVKKQKDPNIDIQLVSGTKSVAAEAACADYYLTTWYQDCTDWCTYTEWSTFYTSTSCGTLYSVTEYLYTLCNNGEGSGGRIRGGDYTPPANKPCAGDPMKDLCIAPSINSGIKGGMFGCVRLGSPFCEPGKKLHRGIDIACPIYSDVYAMKEGIAIHVTNTFAPGQQDEDNELGNYAEVRYTGSDGSNTDIIYAHLNLVYITENSLVTSGQIIGLSGTTGNAGGPNASQPHVHIQISQDGTLVNPAGYFASYISSSGLIYECDPEHPFIPANVIAQSDYDYIRRDEFYIVKTGSDMKSASKIKSSEIKNSKAAEQLFGTNYKASTKFKQMAKEYYTKIVYDNGLVLSIPENQNSPMNFHITSDKYTILLANGQTIKVGMKAYNLKAIFPMSFSKRKVITNVYGKIGKVTFPVIFSLEDAWIDFVLSEEDGVLEEIQSIEPQ